MKKDKYMDNIDITGVSSLELEPAERELEYEKYYEGLARKNLEHVRKGEVKTRYGRAPNDRENWGIWHIETESHTFPILKSHLDRLFGLDKKYKTGLDLGCGTVTFFDLIDVEDSVLIDLSQSYCEFMRKKGWNVMQANAEAIPLSDRWADIIVCSDILEHAPSFDKVLNEVERVLRDDGVLLVSVPWKQDLNFPQKAKQGFTHLRRFDDENIKERFGGWKILSSEVIEEKRYGKKKCIATINLILKKKQ